MQDGSHISPIRVTAAMSYVLLMAVVFSACRPIVEDPSPFASEAGQATVVLGSSCRSELSLGYGSCQLVEDQAMPELHLYLVNPAEYAISDCKLGIFTKGSAPAGPITIDLSALKDQVQTQKFCLLRVEVIERYSDPKDATQLRQIPLIGGFFVEVLDRGYMPIPAEPVVSWCYQLRATNKGRRELSVCP